MLVLGAQVCVSGWGLRPVWGWGHARGLGQRGWVNGSQSVCGLGLGQGPCVSWLWLGATCGGQGWGGQRYRQDRRPSLGSPGTHVFPGAPSGPSSSPAEPGLGAGCRCPAAEPGSPGAELRPPAEAAAPAEVPADREGRGERPGEEEERPVLPHHPHPQAGEAAAHRQPGVQGRGCSGHGGHRGCLGAAATALGLPCCHR